jgi:hypothetical protein
MAEVWSFNRRCEIDRKFVLRRASCELNTRFSQRCQHAAMIAGVPVTFDMNTPHTSVWQGERLDRHLAMARMTALVVVIATSATLITPCHGATFTTDFSSQPAEVQLYGDTGEGNAGVIEEGVVKLTKAVGSLSAGMVIDDLDAGEAVSAFTATFDLLIGGGSGADGFSFNFAPDLPDGPMSEEGTGTGLTVAFDSYDNGNAEAPAIDLKVNGEIVATTPISPRSALAANEFVPVRINLDTDGTVDVSYGSRIIYTNFYTTYFASSGRFGFGARTGGSTDNHWMDNLSITTSTAPQTTPEHPLIVSNSIPLVGASPEPTIILQVQDFSTQVDANSIQLLLNGAATAPTILKEGEITTITYDPPGLLPPGSANTLVLIYSDNATPAFTSTNQFTFTVIDYNGITLPEPIHLETFDAVAEGEFPAGWAETNLTSSINAGIDFDDPNSDAYLGWVVIPRTRLEGAPFDARRLNVAPGYLNDEPVTNLVSGNLVYAESDNRGGNQIQMLFSPDFDLTGHANVHASYNSIYEQNQDSLGAVEYSVDQGATWMPIIIMLDDPDIIRDEQGNIDAAATLNTVQTDSPEVDDGAGGARRTSFGEFLASRPLEDLGPFISARVNDNPTESKRVELFRLPAADNQARVRFRFVQAGTGSWYFGIDNFGLYSIGSTPGDAPTLAISRDNARVTISWPAGSTGFTLESTPSLTTPDWQAVQGVANNSVTVDIDAGNRFFRLRN